MLLNFFVMYRLLNYLRFGHHIVVDELSGWGDEALLTGFFYAELKPGETILVASDGSRFTSPGNKLRRGNSLTALLKKGDEVVEEGILGRYCEITTHGVTHYLPIVIATAGDNVQYFAPVCSNPVELKSFLVMAQRFCKAHQDVPWWLYDKTEKLATWLQEHNPRR